uniref:Heparan-sulfate 6-O-sulfotransferase n=1 Tax=Aplanochytrium stocchinoi TaxID=215587 RepID=A0A6S8FZC4_9STRA
MEGYIDDPNVGLHRGVRFSFYSPIAKKVARPGHVYNRSFFEGHVFHLEWEEAASVFKYPKILDHVPTVRDYLFPVPTKEELKRIEEISFLRKPAKRLASMYNYDRTMARSKMWREKFINERGEKSFEDCLLDSECVKVNELERWCSLQTEFLCGLHGDCVRPLTQKALDRAKANVDEKLVFVGLLERLDESFEMLERLFPVYFEGLSKVKVGHKMKTPEYDVVKNPEAKAVLDRLCRFDNNLYKYVEMAMTKRQRKCGLKTSFV